MMIELVYVMQMKTKYPSLSIYDLLRNVFKDISISSRDTDPDIYTPATPLLNFIYNLVMADHASLPSDQVNRLLLKCDCDPSSMTISNLVVKLQPNETFFETCVEVALICPQFTISAIIVLQGYFYTDVNCSCIDRLELEDYALPECAKTMAQQVVRMNRAVKGIRNRTKAVPRVSTIWDVVTEF